MPKCKCKREVWRWSPTLFHLSGGVEMATQAMDSSHCCRLADATGASEHQTHKQFLPPGCKVSESATLNSRHHLVLHTHTNTLATYIYMHIFLFNLIFPSLETALYFKLLLLVICYMLYVIVLYVIFGIYYFCYLLYADYCVDVGCQVVRISLRCRNLVYAIINTLTLTLTCGVSLCLPDRKS